MACKKSPSICKPNLTWLVSFLLINISQNYGNGYSGAFTSHVILNSLSRKRKLSYYLLYNTIPLQIRPLDIPAFYLLR